MIADQPMLASTGQPSIVDKVRAFVLSAVVVAADGLTWREFGELLVGLLKVTVAALDKVAGMTGEEKKAVVMEAAALLFDMVADKAVPAYVYPLWLVARPAIRSLVLALASGAVEIVLPMVRSAR